MSNGEGGTPSTLTYAVRIGTALKHFFLGGVIRSRGGGVAGGGQRSANPFLGGWGTGTNGEAIHEPNNLKRKRRWSGSGLRRGAMSEEALARRAALKVFKAGARTLRQSLGSPLTLASSSIVAKLKTRTFKGTSGNMSGLPGVTVTTHNGVRQ